MTDEKRKPGRPKGKHPPAVKFSISAHHLDFADIEKNRGKMSRSKFILNKAGYGVKA